MFLAEYFVFKTKKINQKVFTATVYRYFKFPIKTQKRLPDLGRRF
jgi:hypothetical protein